MTSPQTPPSGLTCSCSAPQNVSAVVGQSCELPCKAPPGKDVTVLRWCRQERSSPYIFLYRNDKVEHEGQDPCFSNRINLNESKFLSGDLSLVLKNVSFEDSGTYTCLFLTEDHTRKVVTIHLTVHSDQGETVGHKYEPNTPPGDRNSGDRKRIWTVVSVVLSVVVLTAFVSLVALKQKVFFLQRKGQSGKNNTPSREELLPT